MKGTIICRKAPYNSLIFRERLVGAQHHLAQATQLPAAPVCAARLYAATARMKRAVLASFRNDKGEAGGVIERPLSS
jgi:hypothetical protein